MGDMGFKPTRQMPEIDPVRWDVRCTARSALDRPTPRPSSAFTSYVPRRFTGPLRAIGNVVHASRRLATAEARIVGADGRLYAHGSTTCLVFEGPAG
jgi:hypothetical protein